MYFYCPICKVRIIKDHILEGYNKSFYHKINWKESNQVWTKEHKVIKVEEPIDKK